jgi:cobalt-zinc-cadmium resistance protein CzcA
VALLASGISSSSASSNIALPSSNASNALHREFGFFTGIEDSDLTLPPRLRGLPFSIPAAIGFIALSGVAVLNGLVLVSYINQVRLDGATLVDTVLKRGLTRLRPVLTTALVAALGFVPMAFWKGLMNPSR